MFWVYQRFTKIGERDVLILAEVPKSWFRYIYHLAQLITTLFRVEQDSIDKDVRVQMFDVC